MYTEIGPGWSHHSCHSHSPGREVLGAVMRGEVCLCCLLLIHVAVIYRGFQAGKKKKKKLGKAKLYEILLACFFILLAILLCKKAFCFRKVSGLLS